MTFDIISDTLSRIRNAQRVYMSYVDCKLSKTVCSILDVLKEEGYIKSYSVVDDEKKSNLVHKKARVFLKYYNNVPVIKLIQRVSKPSLRVYTGVARLAPNMNGLGIYILTTSKGIMSDRVARRSNLGGEVICKVF